MPLAMPLRGQYSDIPLTTTPLNFSAVLLSNVELTAIDRGVVLFDISIGLGGAYEALLGWADGDSGSLNFGLPECSLISF
jgi:hypothetical protein